jgi:GTP-binding protein
LVVVPRVHTRAFAARVPGSRGRQTGQKATRERPWKPPPKNRRLTKAPRPGESRVLIIGRPNVGKSTLFNRLSGSRAAIVHPVAGTTRDRREARAELAGLFFTVEDTAGLDESVSKERVVVVSEDVSEGRVNDLTFAAFADADVVLFVVDVAAGLTFMDTHYANIVRKNAGKSPKKPKVFLVANKADSHWAKGYTDELEVALSEFHELGFGDPCPLCAENGDGIAGLFDILKDHVKEVDHEAAAAAALAEQMGHTYAGEEGGLRIQAAWEDDDTDEENSHLEIRSDGSDDDDDSEFGSSDENAAFLEDEHGEDTSDDEEEVHSEEDESEHVHSRSSPIDARNNNNALVQMFDDERLVRVPAGGLAVDDEETSSSPNWHANKKALPRRFQVAIVGVPNVGKSTLMNQLLGKERVLTGPTPGLTRDSISVPFSYEGWNIRLVDTAGIRKVDIYILLVRNSRIHI